MINNVLFVQHTVADLVAIGLTGAARRSGWVAQLVLASLVLVAFDQENQAGNLTAACASEHPVLATGGRGHQHHAFDGNWRADVEAGLR